MPYLAQFLQLTFIQMIKYFFNSVKNTVSTKLYIRVLVRMLYNAPFSVKMLRVDLSTTRVMRKCQMWFDRD